jgi:hypothetical protein
VFVWVELGLDVEPVEPVELGAAVDLLLPMNPLWVDPVIVELERVVCGGEEAVATDVWRGGAEPMMIVFVVGDCGCVVCPPAGVAVDFRPVVVVMTSTLHKARMPLPCRKMLIMELDGMFSFWHTSPTIALI